MTLFPREDFPKLDSPNLIYLDSAATSLKPTPVISAITSYYTHGSGTVHRAIYDMAAEATSEYSETREAVTSFIKAKSSDEIVFTKGATESINLVATSWGETFLQEGDEIVISAMEHHANLVPWQQLARKKKAVLQVIPMNHKGELDLEAFKSLLNPRTRLVAVTHISNAIGTENDLETIIEMAHGRGSLVLVDAAQSAAHIPLNVQELGADFLVFSGHKLFGPTGVGILYGEKELLEAMPPYQYGGDMVDRVTFEHTSFQKPPLRFEAGTPPIASVIGLKAALAYIESFGLKAILDYEQMVTHYAISKLAKLPFIRLIGTAPKKGAIVTFEMNGVHSLDAGTLLAAKGIAVRTGHLCAQPALAHFGCTSAIRASFAPYNKIEEVDALIEALIWAYTIYQTLRTSR